MQLLLVTHILAGGIAVLGAALAIYLIKVNGFMFFQVEHSSGGWL